MPIHYLYALGLVHLGYFVTPVLTEDQRYSYRVFAPEDGSALHEPAALSFDTPEAAVRAGQAFAERDYTAQHTHQD